MGSYICGFFDHDGTGDTTWSKFDSAIYDCRWIGELHPTSLVVTTTERHKPTINISERLKSSISKSEVNKSTINTDEKHKSTQSKSQRNNSSVGTSEG